MIVGMLGGTKDDWSSGEQAWFEYNCWRDHKSYDAELWYHDHQQVTILGDADYDKVDELDTLAKRGEAAMPRVYRVRFTDGHIASAIEDELVVGPDFLDPELGPPPQEEITTARGGDVGDVGDVGDA